MFSSVEQVRALTGYEVDLDLVNQAQGIIEAFIGKSEVQIDNPYDLSLLGKATAYQAAYMSDNFRTVFEQAALIQTYATDGGATYDRLRDSPILAPLAEIAMRKLSWKGIRSVKTGRMFDREGPQSDWSTN